MFHVKLWLIKVKLVVVSTANFAAFLVLVLARC